MKYFTRKQAEKAIPMLEKMLTTAEEIRAKAQSKTELIRVAERGSTIDVPAMVIEKAQIEFLAQCFQEVLQGIEKMGAVLKGLDPGLVDFPCRWEGQEIYLCWRQGEKRIESYHGLEEGFAGRKPLPRNLI
jgi:hypothetical protein